MNVAFLGPEGSYSELALIKHLSPEQRTPCNSIRDIFAAVLEGSVDCGFVPLENILQGPVTETLDQLFEHRGSVHIETSTTMDIVHCLGALPGVQTKDIRRVYSHEQALRQCSRHLTEHLPQAERFVSASTGAAANEVKAGKYQDAAVIGAESTLSALGFEILGRDIADSKGNKTRFAVIRRGPLAVDKAPPATTSGRRSQHVTYVIVDPGRDRQGLLFELLEVISVRHGVNLMFIHSRPASHGVFIFHLNLEGHISDKRIRDCISSLRQFCKTTTQETAEILVCGSYRQERFQELPFHTVGIIGGGGRMGTWFSHLFEEAGLEVLIAEKDSGLSIEELAAKAEVILLSVPMSLAAELAEKVCRYLKPGQLIVENCSVKSSALPVLKDRAPKGVEVLGVHTMFAEDIGELRGENVIITRTPASGLLAQTFEDLLYKYGATISYLSIEEHDRLSACFQSLLQTTMVSFAETIRLTLKDAGVMESFSTPNSRTVVSAIRRVINQTDALLADLQTQNAQYPKLRHLFLSTLFRHISALDHGELETFLASVEESRKFFGGRE